MSALSPALPAGPPRIFVEAWDPGYGSPYRLDPDEPADAAATVTEDDGVLRSHRAVPAVEPPALAFVDGVRRGEAWLFVDQPDGPPARGLAGAFARGAVLVDPDGAHLEHCTVDRLVVWGGGFHKPLPEVAGGWRWEAAAIADPEPDAPLRELQRRMREAEAELAERLADAGRTVVVDGTLHLLRSRDRPVVGYVKTHHRALLEPAAHRRLPGLRVGERTSLLRIGPERVSCYTRIAATPAFASPWSGIVRLEASASLGVATAGSLLEAVVAELPRFAGVPHRDPRAPQNLQPIGALEDHLRHLLGSPALATRAVRETVARLGRDPLSERTPR